MSKPPSADRPAIELGDVYREHVGSVYALCLRLMSECAQAEDLTQEVFVRALRNLHSYRGEGAIGAWLRGIAVHAFLDRRRATIRAAIESGRDLATIPAPPADPSLRLDLERALAGLPEGARTALVLHDIEGYRHDEIAAMLGVSSGTSKSQVFRARRLLLEVLQK